MFCLVSSGPPNPPTIKSIDENSHAIKVTWKKTSSKQDTPITGHVLRITKQGELEKWIDIACKAKSNYFILGNLTRETHYTVWLQLTWGEEAMPQKKSQ